MDKYTFSGHESFHCRPLWLKKGYDFITNANKDKKKSEPSFSDPEAVVDLGVGKNMVDSIAFWMKAFGLLDGNIPTKPSKLANIIFLRDPYLEDIGTLWLLHYQLVKTNFSSIYALVFNIFRKENAEFSKEQLTHFIKRRCEDSKTIFNLNTTAKDINVFRRTYIKPHGSQKNIEDIYTGMLTELGLVEDLPKFDHQRDEWYKIKTRKMATLPAPIFLFAILDSYPNMLSISVDDMLRNVNGVANAFALSDDGLEEKINQIVKMSNGQYVYSKNAGIREFQIKTENINKWEVLKSYYEN